MEKAQRRDAARAEKFCFRRQPFPGTKEKDPREWNDFTTLIGDFEVKAEDPEFSLMSVDTLINGKVIVYIFLVNNHFNFFVGRWISRVDSSYLALFGFRSRRRRNALHDKSLLVSHWASSLRSVNNCGQKWLLVNVFLQNFPRVYTNAVVLYIYI